MLIKDIDTDFSLWAFGKEEHANMPFYELVRSWNKLHDNLFVYPESWNLENEQCFIKTIKGIYKRWLRHKTEGIADDTFGESCKLTSK